MSQLKVNAISDSAGANGNAITLATDGTCTAKITNRSSNIIVNGAMNVAQRGTSGTGSGHLTVDRFYVSLSADEDPTQAQHALTSSDTGPWAKGFRNSLHITNGNNPSNTGGNQSIWYEVEAQDIANSGWDYTSASSYITLSFWVKSSVAQTFYGYIVNNDGTMKRHAFSLGSLSANTWTKVTKSFPGHADLQFDNDNGNGLSIGIYMFAPAGQTDSGVSLTAWATHSGSERMPDFATTWWQTNDATFEITGVQLTATDYCPDYPHISYADELKRCQRYYRLIADNNGGTATETFASGACNDAAGFHTVHTFDPEMRTKPSVDVTTGTDYFKIINNNSGDESSTGPTAVTSRSSARHFEILWPIDSSEGTAGAGGFIYTNNNAAKLAFSAEL